MTKRSEKYRSKSAERLREDHAFAVSYLQSLVVEYGESIQTALATMTDMYGHTELGEKIGMKQGNVTRKVKSLREGRDVKLSTLRQFTLALTGDSYLVDALLSHTLKSGGEHPSVIWDELKEEKVSYG